jgi:hypothetical protein
MHSVQPARLQFALLDPQVASELGIVAAKESAIYEWRQDEKRSHRVSSTHKEWRIGS